MICGVPCVEADEDEALEDAALDDADVLLADALLEAVSDDADASDEALVEALLDEPAACTVTCTHPAIASAIANRAAKAKTMVVFLMVYPLSPGIFCSLS